MIVGREEIKQILNWKPGEAVLEGQPPAEGETRWIRPTPGSRPACEARVVDSWENKDGTHSVLLERVRPPDHARKRQAATSAKLPLTRGQRARLFAGECPHIGGEGNCPVQPGDVVALSSKLSIRIYGKQPKKGGGWTLRYELIDERHKVRKLRRTPGINDESFAAIREGLDEYGYPPRRTDDEDEENRAAAEESAYTAAPSPLSDAGEAVDQSTQTRFTRQAHEHAGQQAEINQARRERHELEQRLERVRSDASLRGVDVSSPLRVIEHQLAKMEKRVYQGKAA